MKTLRDYNDRWNAFYDLRDQWTTEMVLEELSQFQSADEVQRFMRDVIREQELEDYFQDYVDLAEED